MQHWTKQKWQRWKSRLIYDGTIYMLPLCCVHVIWSNNAVVKTLSSFHSIHVSMIHIMMMVNTGEKTVSLRFWKNPGRVNHWTMFESQKYVTKKWKWPWWKLDMINNQFIVHECKHASNWNDRWRMRLKGHWRGILLYWKLK